MRRCAGALLVSALLVAPAPARESVRVLALSDALAPAVLDRVGEDLDLEILVDAYPTPAEVESALRSASADLALLPADAVGGRVRPDTLLPLDPAAVPEAGAVLPALAAAVGPAAARVSVPFDWYPTGFLVNPAKLAEAGLPADPAAGWDVLGQPDLLRHALGCGFGWPGDPREAFAVAAAAAPPGLPEAAARRRTLGLLAELREARKGSTAELADGITGGDLCAAVLPAPDALLAAERAAAAEAGALAFVLPAGGGVLSVDVLAVPAAARNRAAALAVLRRLLRPEVAAANARATHVGSAVSGGAPDAAFDPAWLPRLHPPQPLDAATARSAAAAWPRAR